MVELEMDNHRLVDITKDPISEELIFEFKEKSLDDPDQTETKGIQRIPISIIANWSKIVYHDLYEKLASDFDE